MDFICLYGVYNQSHSSGKDLKAIIKLIKILINICQPIPL